MTSKEFTIWLKGFMTACNEYSPTPKQWDTIKEELDKVDTFVETPGMFQVHPQPPYPGTPIGEGGWGTPNHDLVDRYPWGAPKVWAGDPIDCGRTSGYSQVITTTPNNPISYTISSGSSTATFPIQGSTITYTNNSKPFTTQTDDDLSVSKKFKKRKAKSVKEWEDEIDLGGHE